MLTVLESIRLSTEYLASRGVESPRLNAELLLSEILQCKRLQLYLLFDRPLDKPEVDRYREFISRRGKREPLQYIIGHVEFFGLPIKVDSSVLIPRPETELLIEVMLKQIESTEKINILDIGTGSGNISIALLKNLSNASVTSIDIDENALRLAMENALANIVDERLVLKKLDFLKDDVSILGKFDVIVSNPPYISTDGFEELEPELKDYEPRHALTDEQDGFNFYNNIIQKSNTILSRGGKLFLELGIHQSKRVKSLMLEKSFKNINLVKDYSDIDRIIYGEL